MTKNIQIIPILLKGYNMIEKNVSAGVSQVRPWVRYFARSIDIILLWFLFGFIRLFMSPSAKYNLIVVEFLLLIVWVLIEAKMISSSGYTPGKRLLKAKVLDEYNNKLTFSQALKRSFLVWLIGMGVGILWPATMITGFIELRKEKTTTWDKYSKSKVIHEKVGIFRVIIAIIIYIVFFILALTASLAGLV